MTEEFKEDTATKGQQSTRIYYSIRTTEIRPSEGWFYAAEQTIDPHQEMPLVKSRKRQAAKCYINF